MADHKLTMILKNETEQDLKLSRYDAGGGKFAQDPPENIGINYPGKWVCVNNGESGAKGSVEYHTSNPNSTIVVKFHHPWGKQDSSYDVDCIPREKYETKISGKQEGQNQTIEVSVKKI